MTDSSAAIVARHEQHVMRTYGPPKAVFTHGQGTRLFDPEGNVWLDFLSGLAVTSLGHAHPAVTKAVATQAAQLVHTSNLFLSEPAIALAEALARITGWSDAKTFFAQCGATANEAAIKLARRHGKLQHPDKIRIVTLTGSFHGRTLATLEATGQPEKHGAFQPLAGFVDTVAHDDLAALRAAVTDKTCAIMLEVVQGEGGVRPIDPAVLITARELCNQYGALLIFDEVQTGMGRLGPWFGFQDTPVIPDVLTTAKALANGLPIGACIAHGTAADTFVPGDHATTFGGNPVTCAAALAVIDTIEKDGLLASAKARSQRLVSGLEQLVTTHPVASGVRGKGLLIGLELADDVAPQIEQACRDAHLIVNAIGTRVIRLAPPLTVTRQEIDEALGILDTVLAQHTGK
jgi:acetylornithine aminotransferase